MTTDVPVGEMETRELAVAIYHLTEHRRVVSRDIWNYQEELKRRMTDLDVEALPDSDYDIRLERGGSPKYDPNLLRAKLGELLTPEEMAELIEEIPASEKVSGRSARSLSLKYKGRVADTILAARMNPEPRVVVKAKKSGVELQ